jgi:hypothetical protein
MLTDGNRIVMLVFERKTKKNISKEKLYMTVNNVFEL